MNGVLRVDLTEKAVFEQSTIVRARVSLIDMAGGRIPGRGNN